MRTEFEFIHNIKNKYGLKHIGDDCAVLPKDAENDMVVTADMLVEDIDFRLDWTTPEYLGHKALAVSLSDIAAMGGDPQWAMLTVGVPEHIWRSDFVDAFYEGWFSLARECGVELIGGDVSRTTDKIVIDSIVSGEVPKGKAILRSGAKPGDAIFVSGPLGGASGGLKLLTSGSRLNDKTTKSARNLILKQLRPEPCVAPGKLLQSSGAVSAMIDISDGFSSDLAHLCTASGVGAIIADISVDPNLYEFFPSEESIQAALHGGEDFELLFTVPQEKISALHNLPAIRVGTASANIDTIELISGENRSILLPKGYRHF